MKQRASGRHRSLSRFMSRKNEAANKNEKGFPIFDCENLLGQSVDETR
jgi:hypothetical protein